jgi:hypothetical protein
MAAVNLKLGVEKFWRPAAKKYGFLCKICCFTDFFFSVFFSAIAMDEKQFIKAALLNSLLEPNCCTCQLANFYALIVSRIVRTESLLDWPDLIPVLLEGIKNSTGLQQQRSLMTLVQVVKTTCSKRLPAERNVFEVRK